MMKNPACARRLMDLLTSGIFVGMHAGPPCATWSAVLHAPGGPPYLRTRKHPWGREDLDKLPGAQKHRERLEWGSWYLRCALFGLHCVATTGGSYGPVCIFAAGCLPLLLRYAALKPADAPWELAVAHRGGSYDLLYLMWQAYRLLPYMRDDDGLRARSSIAATMAH